MPPEVDLDAAVLAVKMESMGSDLLEIKTAVRELVSAVSRLAIVEERQVATNGAIERAFKEIAGLSTRISTLEAAQPIQKQSSDFVQSALKYIIAAVLGAVLAGVIRVPPATPPATPPAFIGGK